MLGDRLPEELGTPADLPLTKVSIAGTRSPPAGN